MAEYEAAIGLEVHAQLLTKSKMFCSCSADYAGAEPNTRVCPVCLGMPGMLPVINRKAVEFTIMTGMALHCQIPAHTKWDRKNYPYPDLPKGYQISQYDLPLAINGYLAFDVEGERKRVGIRRVHLEEDTGRLYHVEEASLVDFNRSGVPLMEIVSEPDIRSPEEAREYLVQLRMILRYLGVSTADMEAGAFRCDANISVRRQGEEVLGVPVEVKNMNSFRAVKLALEYELVRQSVLLTRGEPIERETRGWVSSENRTVSQRSKEEAHDYRYFPEPDLPPLEVAPAWVAEIGERIPELPEAKRQRFVRDYELSAYDAGVLTADRDIAGFYEQAVEIGTVGETEITPKVISNWVTGELFRLMKEENAGIESVNFSPTALVGLIRLVQQGLINANAGKSVLDEMFRTGQSPEQIVEAKGLAQISEVHALASVIRQVLDDNPKPVREYLEGKKQALGFLVGQVMRATRGKANPKVVNRLLQEALRERS
ncbi:MAG: Asp-tRNA(Asn)/Glu-tRNA(Gln) amidotransferase subunit GatB [Chloroflexi bacterium]|nr:Asp-tRNA(Asn)/Glu-tRNA(Gln) amidotransferase subunit GatB [Chloroflexota bacterium]